MVERSKERAKREKVTDRVEFKVADAQEIHRVARRLAIVMKVTYACEGISTRQHNEPAGNQDVWHYHLHVTPRYKNDNYYSSQGEFMSIEHRAKHAEALRKSLYQSL